jgi:hypothetical protein
MSDFVRELVRGLTRGLPRDPVSGTGSGVGSGGGLAATLLGTETQGLSIVFTDGSMVVRDTGTPANNYSGSPYAKLTYTAPSPKMCRQADGVLRYGAHNLYLNSEAPANQSVTVVSGMTYNIVITGSVSITWSGAYAGTTTAGTTSITAATGTLTGGSTSGAGTVAIYRTPNVGTYLPTTSAAVYQLPYEWDSAGVPLGIRVEEARTNLFVRSQEFNTFWTNTSISVTADNTTAPDGTTTADKITCSAANAAHFSIQAITWTAAIYTISMWFKYSTHPYAQLNTWDGAKNTYANFDVQNGTVGTTSGVTSGIESYGNGWYRCWMKTTANQNAAAGNVGVYLVPASTSTAGAAINAAGTEALFAWGAQNELGAFPTSYIQTASATVTRAADIITLTTSLFPLSQVNSTVFAEACHNGASGGRNIIEMSATARSDTLLQTYFSGSTSVTSAAFAAGFAAQSNQSSNISATPAFHKIGARVATNNFGFTTDGVSAADDTSGTFPAVTLTRFYIGSNNGGGQHLNSNIKQLMYLPRLMTNAELVTVTS